MNLLSPLKATQCISLNALVAYIYTQPTNAPIIHPNIHVEIVFSLNNCHEMKEFQHACIMTYLVQIGMYNFLLFHGLVPLTYPPSFNWFVPCLSWWVYILDISTSNCITNSNISDGIMWTMLHLPHLFASFATFPTFCPFPLVSSLMV